MANDSVACFSADYPTARRRFLEAAKRLGWQIESCPIGATGPDGDALAFDVACSQTGNPHSVIVVSSGVHGVEGFFGSAMQLALMEHWASSTAPAVRCVFLHGLNPYGFAWLRRFDEQNVDPNRNFLLPDERFEGVPDGYQELDPFLNPRRPPSSWDPFLPKALWLVARKGMPALRQAVAGGQYHYPRGLFFGGKGPSRTQQLLEEHLPRWLHGSQDVVHLDFHTGLGRHGECKLLIDYVLSESQRARLTQWFGPDSFEASDSAGISYDARGGFGRWCVSQRLAPRYLFACAEFGTYHALRVLRGLRAENQAHHWGAPDAASTILAKQRLRELFCPAADAWRQQVIAKGLDLVERAQQGLLQIAPA